MTPTPVWTQHFQVRASETDIHNLWKPTAFFEAFQDAANNHAANLGFDYQTMRAAGRLWVLARLKVYFYRFPTMFDELTIRTWPNGIRQKIFFTREFQITAADGAACAAATSAWLLIDANARRMLLPSALPGSLPDNSALPGLDEDLMKMDPADGLTERFSVEAGYSAVDLLGHVNNVRYIDWIMDCFPFEHFEQYQLTWLQINFNKEVRAGESVRIFAGPREHDPNRWLVTGEKTGSGEKAFEAELAWIPR